MASSGLLSSTVIFTKRSGGTATARPDIKCTSEIPAGAFSVTAKVDVSSGLARGAVALSASRRVYSISCACCKSNPDILVAQPAENWAAKNVPGPLDGARDRRILLQG